MYYLYHIPGKKIGVTRNLFKRVTLQQGYAADEYEVLLSSEDIDYISTKELELQQSYGYKKDLNKYKNVINKMKLNPTEQTTTFPVPLRKLRGRLLDNKGLKWETVFGEFEINEETIPWILKNARTSMFNDNRCYVYNKAFYEAFKHQQNPPEKNRFDLIREWAKERGIYDRGDSKTQYVKLMEEAGELAQALLKRNHAEIYDAIGDMVVVLTNLAELEDVRIEECIDYAYHEISNRKGEMINGTFVKQTL